ncbi:peptidylprolyl isomerase [Inhella crocodyli]|nr:peptidylprolyl isomerase [Inhella crocodyli]
MVKSLLSSLIALSLGGAVLATLPVHEAQAQTKKTAKTSKAKAKPAARKPAPSAKGTAKAAGSANSPGMLAGDAALAQAQALDAQAVQAAAARKAAGSPALNTGEVMNATTPDDWREPDPQNVVLMEIRPSATAAPQQVWMELAPRFAPEHAANIRALVRGGYFDGLAVLRVQDNFVTQWGDPGDPVGADNAKTRPLPEAAKPKLPAEFDTALAGLPLHALVETDGWAPLNGFVDGFPVAADPAKTPQGRAWLAHCYGVVGAGRGNEIDSSNGASLYAVIGHSPRPLDLNITVVGRILKGIEHLAALPRGGGNMGFYKPEEARPPLMSAKLLADLPAAERPKVQVLRTDTLTWANLLHTRRYRGGWYVASSGRVDLCSSTVPVRVTPPTAPVNP